MKKVLSFLSNVFGFNKLSKHENTYLHESNIRTGIYMATIIVILEIWIILRQYKKYVIPTIEAGGVLDKELFTKIIWKMQIFGCFFAKNLHNSKKSATFASAFALKARVLKKR